MSTLESGLRFLASSGATRAQRAEVCSSTEKNNPYHPYLSYLSDHFFPSLSEHGFHESLTYGNYTSSKLSAAPGTTTLVVSRLPSVSSVKALVQQLTATALQCQHLTRRPVH